ncbi:hypothetical protein B0O99DRAFT_639549 [Bisporella sp. PMI_857]|nr:hypothetical protein B0O99DRAFT_639549 [Bisporella sp. PMI_857]
MASWTIKNVTVVGANSTIGAPIVEALLANGAFNVSALSRSDSSAKFPSGVEVKKADYTSHNSLVEALKGQDAVICSLNDKILSIQYKIIEAAIEAGVIRFIPSEWGQIDVKPPVPELEEDFQERLKIIDFLDQKALNTKNKERVFHWTAVNNGIFFDWSLQAAFLDITLSPTNTASIWSQGVHTFSVTNLSTVVSAVISILTTAESDTRDRLVYIESFATSQAEVLSALEKVSGEKWAVKHTTVEEQLTAAKKELSEANYWGAWHRWIKSSLFSGKPGARFDPAKLDNELLGLKKENLEDSVAKILKGERI